MINLTNNLLNKYPPKKGVIGRYSCSKIWAMINGYLSPEDYLQGEEIDFTGAMNMFNGTMKHEAIQSLLEEEYTMEVKKEMKVKDFEIVGMADCLNIEELLEIKTSFKEHDKAKPWATHQIKLYLTLFKIPQGRIVQPIRTQDSLFLKVLGEYKRNDDWFNNEMDKLAAFHSQLIN